MNESIALWSGIWKWTLIVGGAAYLLLMVYVILVGALDIRYLYRSLRQAQDDDDAAAAKAARDATRGR